MKSSYTWIRDFIINFNRQKSPAVESRFTRQPGSLPKRDADYTLRALGTL
jgi:hypothetical protein